MATKSAKDKGILFWRGSWWARFYVDGREKRQKCTNRTQARELYIRRKAAVIEKRYSKDTRISFRNLATEYLEELEVRHGRKSTDRSRLDHWKTVFGNQDMATITTREIQRELTKLRLSGLAPATIIRHIAILKACIN